MKNINDWLSEYGESHQNPTNKLVHWICVPTIFFSIVGLLYGIKLGYQITPTLEFNVAMAVLAFVVAYYVRLSPMLAVGMFLFSVLCLFVAQKIEAAGFVLWQVCLALFVLAWIGQFWGHKVEGKKPSFFQDIQFLMIGPAWLMSFIYGRLGLRY
ncbi:MAG: Mpo1-like protein [Saprospiraceae bacterium]